MRLDDLMPLCLDAFMPCAPHELRTPPITVLMPRLDNHEIKAVNHEMRLRAKTAAHIHNEPSYTR